MSEYCIYWLLRHDGNWISNHQFETDLVVALKVCELLRQSPDVRFVTMVAEHSNMVGKPGVDSVKHEDYEWSKRRDSMSAR